MMNFTLVVQDFRTFKYFVREKLRVFSLRGFSYVRGKGGDDLSPSPPPIFPLSFVFLFFFYHGERYLVVNFTQNVSKNTKHTARKKQ